jgi:hypothetical protein
VIEPYYPFNNSSVEDFTIGREDCEDRYGMKKKVIKMGSNVVFALFICTLFFLSQARKMQRTPEARHHLQVQGEL